MIIPKYQGPSNATHHTVQMMTEITCCSDGICGLGGLVINGLWPPAPPDGDALPDSTDSLSLGSIAPERIGVQAIIGPGCPAP